MLKNPSVVLLVTGSLIGCATSQTNVAEYKGPSKALAKSPKSRTTDANAFQIHYEATETRGLASIASTEEPAPLVYKIKNISDLKSIEAHAARFDQGYQKIEIIPESAGTLTKDKTSETFTVAEATNKDSNITLTRNLYEPRGGAKDLFAPGSVVADTAYWYLKQKQVQFKVEFKEDKMRRRYSDVKLEFSLDPDGKLSVTSDDVWLVVSQVESPTLVIDAIYPKSDYRFEIVESRGSGKNFEIVMKDIALAEGSDDGKSAFEVEVFGRSWMIGKQQQATRMTVPEDAVKRKGKMIHLKLGSLRDASALFKPGKKIGLKVTAVRKVDGTTMSQNLRYKAQIPTN